MDAWRTMQRAHAIANGVYVASPNRIGHEDEPGTDGITFFGHSFIADPFGRYVAEAGRGRGDPHRPVRPGADRNRAPQLAVPPRSPRGRLRADPEPVPRARDDAGSLRMPAEWEPHRATWISWPHHEPDWPGKLGPIPWVYAEIVRVIAAHEPRRNPLPRRRRAASRADGAAGARRAHGPRAAARRADRPRLAARLGADRRRRRRRAASCWSNWAFNGWAKYDNYAQDPGRRGDGAHHGPATRVEPMRGRHRRAASCSKAAASRSTAEGLVLVPRSGCSATCRCATPGSTRADYERLFADVARRAADDLARRGVRRRRHARPRRRHRPVRQRPTRSCWRSRRTPPTTTTSARSTTCGASSSRRPTRRRPLRIVTLPFPRPVMMNGERLPASYANFYIGNGFVIVPTFNDPNDRVALNTLAELMPGARGGRHPRRRSGVGAGHAALPDAAGTGGRRTSRADDRELVRVEIVRSAVVN